MGLELLHPWPAVVHRRQRHDHDLDDAKAKFRETWARICAGLTELDIARAALRRTSREALARYDRKR
jgi:hypothetical protein